jgi:hypothetical protein
VELVGESNHRVDAAARGAARERDAEGVGRIGDRGGVGRRGGGTRKAAAAETRAEGRRAATGDAEVGLGAAEVEETGCQVSRRWLSGDGLHFASRCGRRSSSVMSA